MAIKRVPPVGLIRLKNPDNSLMVGDDGNPSYARGQSPSSKVWQAANAQMHRAGLKRVREGGGRIEAMADSPEDSVDFLRAVVDEFINLPSGISDAPLSGKDLVNAVLADEELGYIKDFLKDEMRDWGAFLPLSTLGSPTGFASMSG